MPVLLLSSCQVVKDSESRIDYTEIIQLFIFFVLIFLFDADLVNKPFTM